MNSGVIYKITNNVNGKSYIGQALSYLSDGRKWGTEKRFQCHINNAIYKQCDYGILYKAIRKYGKDNFKVDELMKCDIKELNSKEKYYIDFYNTITPNGYNLMTGGGNGRVHHKLTRDKMSKTRTGKKHSDITKERIRKSNIGKTCTKQQKQNISNTSKFRGMNEEKKNILIKALNNLNMDVLPMYIYFRRERNGYESITVKNEKHKVIKTFGDRDKKLEEKIKSAIEYQNSLTTTVVGTEESHNSNEVLNV
jgi:group I intron endonuclease